MNHWLAEELTRHACIERQREFEAHCLQTDFVEIQGGLPFTARAALKLSDWLIVSGKNLRHHYERNTSASFWIDKRKFAR